MPEDIWTVAATMRWTEDFLSRKGVENPRRTTQDLMSAATGLSRLELYTQFEKPLTPGERDAMRDFVRRRAGGEPLQYIVGTAPFRYQEFEVAPGVLIPRPETEGLVGIVLEHLAAGSFSDGAPALAADIGTGSGCIACSIASEFPESRVWATDCSPEALAIAARNAERLGVDSRIRFAEGDLGSGIPDAMRGRFDAVASNPPYIPTGILPGLPHEVAAFEPGIALDGGADGLDVFRRLAPWAYGACKPGALFACELFEEHMDEAAAIAREAGFEAVSVKDDLAGRPRYLLAYRPESG